MASVNTKSGFRSIFSFIKGEKITQINQIMLHSEDQTLEEMMCNCQQGAADSSKQR